MGGRGSGGRNKKTVAQRKAEGNRGRRKLNQGEPAALPGEPKQPRFLTAEMRVVWRELVPLLSEKKVLDKADGIALGTLCSSYVLFRQSDASVAEKQREIAARDHEIEELESQIDRLTKHLGAAVRRRSDALRHLRADWQAFGLDPASSSGISTGTSSDHMQSALDKVLRAKSSHDDVVM